MIVRSITWTGALIASAMIATGCDEPHTTSAPAGLDEATEAERRLRVHKGDLAGSCADSCGGAADTGACWCDDLCDKYGDCCDDFAAACQADAPCYAAGCSGQVCSDDPDVITICDFKPEYACYGAHSTCERQPDGQCGWTPTEALDACIDDVGTGCPAVLCADECPDGRVLDDDGCETCECLGDAPPAEASCAGSCGDAAPGGACFCDAQCEAFGDCCEDKADQCDGPPACPPSPLPDPADCPDGELVPQTDDAGCVVSHVCVEDEAPCYVGGCSAQLCSDQEGVASTCEWHESYACYQEDFAVCERQADGQCGWTQSDPLLSCLDDASQSCDPIMCTLYCETGFRVDADGCEICACNPPASACDGHCGGKAPEGCWCDASCAGYGDCCPGKHQVCD